MIVSFFTTYLLWIMNIKSVCTEKWNMCIAYSGREGAKDSAVGVWPTGRDREIATGRSLELASWSPAMSARVRRGADSSLRAMSRRHARPTTRACWVSLQLSSSFISFCLFFEITHLSHTYHCPVYYRNISCTAIPLYGDSSE